MSRRLQKPHSHELYVRALRLNVSDSSDMHAPTLPPTFRGPPFIAERRLCHQMFPDTVYILSRSFDMCISDERMCDVTLYLLDTVSTGVLHTFKYRSRHRYRLPVPVTGRYSCRYIAQHDALGLLGRAR